MRECVHFAAPVGRGEVHLGQSAARTAALSSYEDLYFQRVRAQGDRNVGRLSVCSAVLCVCVFIGAALLQTPTGLFDV